MVMMAAVKAFTCDNTKDSRNRLTFLDIFVKLSRVSRRLLHKWEGSYS